MCLICFIFAGNSFKTWLQTSPHRSPDQANPASNKVPHAPRGHSQILTEGRPGGRGRGPELRFPRHDRRSQPGQ